MKVHRLWLVPAIALLLCSPQASAQLTGDRFGSWTDPTVGHSGVFRSVADPGVIFRGQSPDTNGVPIPPGAGVTPSNSSPMPSTFAEGQIITQGDPGMMMPAYPETTTWNAFSPPTGPDPFLTPQYSAPGMYGAPGAPGMYGATPYAPYTPYQPGMPPQGMSFYGANVFVEVVRLGLEHSELRGAFSGTRAIAAIRG